MSNMSYCRFENTLRDLKDCYSHLDEDTEDLNEYEGPARRDLIELCIDIAMEFGDEVGRPVQDLVEDEDY